MTTQSQAVCPGSIAQLSWLIPDTIPALHYHVIVKDPNGHVLLNSDTQNAFGTLAVTAPRTPGQYTYTVTVIRDDYGNLSDVAQLVLNVTQTALSNVYISDNPLLPGTPFTVYWTANTVNPQSGELVTVTIHAPPNSLGAPTYFQAYYPNGSRGSATFIAPDIIGTFPITIAGISKFGCSDIQTIMLETKGIVVHAGHDRTIMVNDSTVLGSGAPISDTTYTWSPSDGLNTLHGLNPIASPLETTTYTVIAFRPGTGEYASDHVTVSVINPAKESPPIISYHPAVIFAALLLYFGAFGILTFLVLGL